jgi:hypothetical protein
MNALSTPHPSHDEIALQAFLLWEKEGRQPGREMAYWLEAEAQLQLTRQQQVEAAAKAVRPWPPQPSAPKLATARAIAPAVSRIVKPAAASRGVAAKRAVVTKPVRKSSRSVTRKALARN